MLSLSPATRIFVALEPIDMRKSFNGLSAAVDTVLAQDVASGHLFLFTNRLRNQTTFSIPIECRRNPLPVASAARKAGPGVSTHRTSRR